MIKFDNKFSERLSLMRKTHSMTQSGVASEIGITQRQIAAYESGQAKPREKVLLKLAFTLGVPPTWLANGTQPENNDNCKKKYYPEVVAQQIPLYSMKDVEKIEFLHEDPNFKLHPCFISATDEAYAFRVTGDAMEFGNGLGFPDNSIVTVDANYEFTNGGFYLIIVNNVIVFRQLFKDELKTTFKSLNPNYSDSVYNNDEYTILAKAVYLEIDLDDRA